MADTPKATDALLPCPVPWCHADLGPKAIRWPVVANKTTQWAVHCEDCDLYGSVGDSEAEAIAAWNNRPLITSSDEGDGLRRVFADERDHLYRNGATPLVAQALHRLAQDASAETIERIAAALTAKPNTEDDGASTK
jgi:hypothetical protein